MQTVFGARLIQHALNAAAPAAVAMPSREITYAELLGRVRNCAVWLAQEHEQQLSLVGITIADEVTHLVVSLALLSLGVPQVYLSTRDPVAKRLDLAQRLAVGRVVATDPRHVLPGIETLLLPESVFDSIAGGATLPDAIDADPEAPAIYTTSSGTTGEPKIFALSQRAQAWRATGIADTEHIGRGHRLWTPIAVEDPMGRARRHFAAYLGVTSVFQDPRPAPALSMQELCTRLRVTCVELSALQIASIVLDQTDPRPLPAGTVVYTAGARVTTKLRNQFKSRFGVTIFHHYGAREFGRISDTYPGGEDDDLETVGVPVPWIDLEIVDGDDKRVPAGEIGELRVRSDCMCHEYFRDPIATSRHFKDGWFYPRDLCSLTPTGRLRIHGRADDMMNMNGIKIFPAEIERVLEEHPGVKAAVAFARASRAHGDIPVAGVELHGTATVGAEELAAYARERLGARAPRKIFVLESLPRNAAGKIVKRELAQLVAPSK